MDSKSSEQASITRGQSSESSKAGTDHQVALASMLPVNSAESNSK